MSDHAAPRQPARTARAFARLVWRKAVYRRVLMGRWGVPTGQSMPPRRRCELTIELWGPDRFDAVLSSNPHLTEEDLKRFQAQHTTCIVVLDGDLIVASSWMTNGDVYVHELDNTLTVPRNEHFSCRSYVDDAHHGMALMSHMIHAYSAAQPADDEVWGLVYEWNTSSVSSLERIGWRRSGDYWTTWWFDRPHHGFRRYAPVAPTELKR